MTEKQFDAGQENLSCTQTFLNKWYEDNSIDSKISSKISICCDEVLSNIVFYSKASIMTLQCEKSESEISIAVIDDGTAFNPLTEAKEPNITAPAMEREIGGLGIFMVKKFSSSVSYERKDNKNVLTIKFNL